MNQILNTIKIFLLCKLLTITPIIDITEHININKNNPIPNPNAGFDNYVYC